MRKGLLGSIAVLTAGAGLAYGQGPSRGMAPPAPIMPSGLYSGGVQQASHGTPDIIPSPIGQPAMNGIPQDPSGMGQPMYPQPGMYGGSPYPDAGMGGPGGGGANSSVPNWWFNGEYCLWFSKSQTVTQPFVTTSSPGDFGVIGAPTTQLLYSPKDISYGAASGFRLMGGWWKDTDKRCGFEFGGFLMEEKTKLFGASSDNNGVPTLARPFIQAGGGQSVFIVSNLGLASGSIGINTTTRAYGLEANGIYNLYRSCPDSKCFWSVDSIVGFRFFQLREDLNFATESTILNGGATFVGQPVANGSQIIINDGFETINRFYGANLGLRSSVVSGRWIFSSSAKIALGAMTSSIDVTGITTLRDAGLGLNSTAQGGVLATQQNIGNYHSDNFAVMPEIALNLGYQWTSCFSTYIGYNGLYANKVLRPGNSLPTAVNPSLMPSSNNYGVGAVTPVINNSTNLTEYYIQGVTFGFRLQF
ncbi:hypothetical protein BH11PLA2_BH11PLA2_47440 [soil metagenome]